LGDRTVLRIDPNRAEDMLANALPFAYGSELKAKVIQSPDSKLIKKFKVIPLIQRALRGFWENYVLTQALQEFNQLHALLMTSI